MTFQSRAIELPPGNRVQAWQLAGLIANALHPIPKDEVVGLEHWWIREATDRPDHFNVWEYGQLSPKDQEALAQIWTGLTPPHAGQGKAEFLRLVDAFEKADFREGWSIVGKFQSNVALAKTAVRETRDGHFDQLDRRVRAGTLTALDANGLPREALSAVDSSISREDAKRYVEEIGHQIAEPALLTTSATAAAGNAPAAGERRERRWAIRELTQADVVTWSLKPCWTLAESLMLLSGLVVEGDGHIQFPPTIDDQAYGVDVDALKRAIAAGDLTPLAGPSDVPVYRPRDIVEVARTSDVGAWRVFTQLLESKGRSIDQGSQGGGTNGGTRAPSNPIEQASAGLSAALAIPVGGPASGLCDASAQPRQPCAPIHKCHTLKR